MQTLKFLGIGSAFNIEENNTSAYIKEDNILLLIDCGETIFKEIQRINLLDDVKEVNVLITHLHSDHVGSLSSLIYYCYYIKNIKVNIYYPDQDLYKLLKLNGNKGFNYHLIEENIYYYIHSNIRIRYRINNHVDNMKCYGINLTLYSKEYNNINIFYSGDTNRIDLEMLTCLFIGGINEFYQDTCLNDYPGNVHLSFKKLCEAIPKKFRSKVYCIHLDNNNLKNKILKEGFNMVMK